MVDRLNRETLLEELQQWNRFLKRKVRLIACGGTAMTLLNVKESTKDVDFMVPEAKEYQYLLKTLLEIGYEQVGGHRLKNKKSGFVYDLYCGNKIHTTELLNSPLEEGGSRLLKELGHIYVGTLNYYDLIISKIIRGHPVDFDDCLLLYKKEKAAIDLEKLKKRYLETISFDVSEQRVKGHIDFFIVQAKKRTKK